MSKKRLANGQAFEADATYVTGVTGRFDEETQAEFREWKEKGWKVVKEENESLKNLQTSENGIRLIMKHEEFRAYPYNDAVGHATIGYGTLLHKGNVTKDDKNNYPNGISEDDAKQLLVEKVKEIEPKLLLAVKVKLNQNQFDALISWTYNLGTGRLNEHHCSWLKNLNNGEYDKVPDGLMQWNKAADKNGKLIELPGLTKRRKEEGELFKKKI
jgi:GH24 family phage-related lysozyme (muramidase)